MGWKASRIEQTQQCQSVGKTHRGEKREKSEDERRQLI